MSAGVWEPRLATNEKPRRMTGAYCSAILDDQLLLVGPQAFEVAGRKLH